MGRPAPACARGDSDLWVGLGVLHAVGEAPMGIFTTATWTKAVGSALVAWPLAVIGGARFYTEPAA